MVFCDAHFHLAQCGLAPNISKMDNCSSYFGCTCAHEPSEFEKMEKMSQQSCENIKFFLSYGIHPQNPDSSFIPYLEKLLIEKKLNAIGEAGFDLFTEEFKSKINEQEEVWGVQLELAAEYNLPIVVHCRKALDKLFRDSKKLKKIPAVIFHSFMGGSADALSLLRKNINCFFSFGKPLINGKKSAIACVKELPLETLLFETDAPFQTLKGEDKTFPEEIVRVYDEAASIRGVEKNKLSFQIEKNFSEIFCC